MTDVLIKRELLEHMRNFTVMHDSGVAGVLRGSIDATLRNQPAPPERKAFKRGMPEWLCAHCGSSEIFHEPGGYCMQAVTYSTTTTVPAPVAAPADGEAVEVVAYRVSLPSEPELGHWFDEHAEGEPQMCQHEPLMTIAQHQRIVAQRDAAIEEWSGTAVQNGMECDRLNAKLAVAVGALKKLARVPGCGCSFPCRCNGKEWTRAELEGRMDLAADALAALAAAGMGVGGEE